MEKDAGIGIPAVAEALKELSQWLGASTYKDKIDQIIGELENPDIDGERLRILKSELSMELLFHPKCLGDVDVPGFVGDGTSYAWWNYLAQISRICQANL